jgi:hypothetical protein
MTIPQATADAGERTQIEAALADYPHISADRLTALIAWFRKDASALDVAMLASNAALAERYRQFRADHIDPVTSTEVVRVLALLSLLGAIILFFVWRAI